MTPRQTRGVIRWEAPPDIVTPDRVDRRPHKAWVLVALDLRDNPGEWGLVDEDCGSSASVSSRINNGETSWWQPAGSFFAVQRTVDGIKNVYAVFLGENHEYAEQAGVKSLLRRAS